MTDISSSEKGAPTCEMEEWVHATNASAFREGQVFGWPDSSSPTGFLSGIVVRSDHKHLRVLVRDIVPATIKRSR